MALNIANPRRIVPMAATAALFARVVAKVSKHAGHRQSAPDRLHRLGHVVFLNLAQQGRDVQSKGAEALARSQTIPDVIAEEQLKGCASRLMDLASFALNDHPRMHLDSAGRNHFPVDFHEADLAGIERPA